MIQENEIYGRWQLIKIELNSQMMQPKQIDYYLTLTENSVSYNLDVNTCGAYDLTLINNRINYGGGCTKICCDSSYDEIAKYIDYRGDYKVEKNELIISTDSTKIFLHRTMNKD